MGFDEGEFGDESEKVTEATTTFIVFRDHFGDAILRATVGGEGAFLSEGRWMRGGVALDGFDHLRESGGGGNVAEAPTGHGVGFAEAIDGEG